MSSCCISRAPLKATLAGEHAVVYGYPAVVAAVERRILVRVCRIPGEEHRIYSQISFQGLVVRCSSSGCWGELRGEQLEKPLSYIISAISIASESFGRLGGLSIEILSDIPPGAGLGTSAAISAGILACYSRFAGRGVGARELASLARRVEASVQGAASPMDTGAVALGGVLLVDPRDPEPLKPLKLGSSLELLVAYTPKKKTTGEAVKAVRSLLERRRPVVEKIMETIGAASLEAARALERGDLEALGEVMTIAHGLLKSLGIVDPTSERIWETMISAGLSGAKICGGGWGGAVIGVSPSAERLKTALEILTRSGYSAFIASTSPEGLEAELEHT